MLSRYFNRRMTGKPSKALLMASLGTACCLLTPWAIAGVVTNCNDQGIGSLRQAILDAPENGVVDATGLAGLCSVITVKTGDIQVAVNDLTILGPGADALSITTKYLGNGRLVQYNSRIFNHTGTGTLTLKNLSVANGLLTTTGNQTLYGGCIYSKGNVSLIQSTVTGCKISPSMSNTVNVAGGGIFAFYKIYLLNSQVIHNTVTGDNSYAAAGGGVATGSLVGSGFEAHGSVISGNTVTGGPHNSSYTGGGGLRAAGPTDIESTTISGNSVSGSGTRPAVGGGASFNGSVFTLTIRNSTISGNSSSGSAGGINASTDGQMTLLNSTIAFNQSGQNNAPGALINAKNFDFESNILTNNTWGSAGGRNDLQASISSALTGSHNLVFATISANLPTDTLIGKCPLLGPLRNNGGPTPTHALLSHSPAIDAGSNPANLSNDQRGSPYLRTLGSGTDIGAYEVDPADIIFNSGFDGC